MFTLIIGDEKMKRKLKKLTVPAVYAIALLIFGTSMYLVQSIVNKDTFTNKTSELEYVDKEIVNDNLYIPVVVQNNIFVRPYVDGTVTINKQFYDYDEPAEDQENSIILYENTYIQNSGVSYKSENQFQVVSVLDGTVIEVTDNKILGTTIKIRHENDIISTYQSLSEINVKVDDYVVRGQMIAMSGTCTLFPEESNLHFELTHQGKNINPEKYYDKTTDEL
jgi:stage II sporulation protein Q